jgi:hypothetical protein
MIEVSCLLTQKTAFFAFDCRDLFRPHAGWSLSSLQSRRLNTGRLTHQLRQLGSLHLREELVR